MRTINRLYKVVKFKYERKIFSGWKNKRGNTRDSNASPIASQAEIFSVPLCGVSVNALSITKFIIKKLKFFSQKSCEARHLKKIVSNMQKIDAK